MMNYTVYSLIFLKDVLFGEKDVMIFYKLGLSVILYYLLLYVLYNIMEVICNFLYIQVMISVDILFSIHLYFTIFT